MTNRFLFQRKEDIRGILKRLSENIVTILDLDQVAGMILKTFEDTLRAETGVILLKNTEGYEWVNSYGLDWRVPKPIYPPTDPLIRHLENQPGALYLETEESASRLPLLVTAGLERLKALLAIPLRLHGELIGVLTLGKKKSDQEYSPEEIDYFPTLAVQIAIALSNARLYKEHVEARKKIEEMQLELIHREKMAFVADLVKGIAHEVFNPLLPIFHTIENLEREIFVGMFDIFKKEENHLDPSSRKQYLNYLKEFRDYVNTLKRNARHIHLGIDTLNRMQKEDQETIWPMAFTTFLQE